MRIGILGGTFDPIHLAHLLIAEVTQDGLGLDRVLFVPAGEPPHKRQLEKTTVDHRCRMVELAIEDNPHFELSRVDLERTGPHYSVDTVALIRKQYDLSAEDCFFIIGGDSLQDLPTWHQPERLISLCRLAAVCRPGYQPEVTALERVIPGLAARLDWVEIPPFDLSATLIRAKIARGYTIRYHVPDKVRKYIEAHRLYQADALST